MVFWAQDPAASAVAPEMDVDAVRTIASAAFTTAVTLYVSYGVYKGTINLLHIHHEVFHFHQLSTVFSALALASTFSLSFFPKIIAVTLDAASLFISAFTSEFGMISAAFATVSSSLPRLHAFVSVAVPVLAVHVVGIVLAFILSIGCKCHLC